MEKSKDLISLRDFTRADIKLKIKWINDPENHRYLHYNIPLEYKKTIKWFEQKDNSKRVDCIIEFNQEPIGLIGLLSIDKQNSKAEYYITIGSNSHKKRGIATIATYLILEYAFEDILLNKVYLNVDADNKAACHLYERVGFNCEGLFCEDLINNNEFIDRKRYAFLKKDWDYEWRKNR